MRRILSIRENLDKLIRGKVMHEERRATLYLDQNSQSSRRRFQCVHTVALRSHIILHQVKL